VINWWQNIEFEQAWFLLLLGLIPLLVYWKHFHGRRYEYHFPLPNIEGIRGRWTVNTRIYQALPYIRMIALAAFIIAMARPKLALKEEVVKADGIDIMMVLDLSSSMLSRDFKPNRLEASKLVAKDFISNRPYDRIGLSVFSGEAFTLCPLTGDHEVLNQMIDEVQAGILLDGTAIGNGLSAAVNRLKDADTESKVAILLTDGVNNRGYIEPATAIRIASEFGVRVYTIGVGTNGLAQSPVGKNRQGEYYDDYVRVNIDEALLREIARETGGQYYRAKNEEELKAVYDEIDKLEKTEIEINVFKRYSDEFAWFVWTGMILFFMEILLRWTLLKTMPV